MELSQLLDSSATQAVLLAPVVTMLVQGYKQTGLEDRLVFPSAMITGVALGVITACMLGATTPPAVATAVMSGLAAGLMSSGLWSGLVKPALNRGA